MRDKKCGVAQAISQPSGQGYSGDKLHDFDDCISTEQVLLMIRNHEVLTSPNELSDSRRTAPVERRVDAHITSDSQPESAAAVCCRPLRHLCGVDVAWLTLSE